MAAVNPAMDYFQENQNVGPIRPAEGIIGRDAAFLNSRGRYRAALALSFSEFLSLNPELQRLRKKSSEVLVAYDFSFRTGIGIISSVNKQTLSRMAWIQFLIEP